VVPDSKNWIHEIKHDGYRLIVQRDRNRVRLFTRNGHDWSGHYPLITEAALRNRNTSFVIDGESVLLGVDGVSDFDGLHSRKHDAEVEFYAFDCLVSDGGDLRKLPLTMRKTNLARLLARRVDGILFIRLRTRRDRPGAVSPRLPDGIGGAGVEAEGSIVSSRSIAELDQGEEPPASSFQAGDGSTLARRSQDNSSTNASEIILSGHAAAVQNRHE
jgi:ATP dependent DNA ligase domain